MAQVELSGTIWGLEDSNGTTAAHIEYLGFRANSLSIGAIKSATGLNVTARVGKLAN